MTLSLDQVPVKETNFLGRLRVLHVEDSDNDALILARILEKEAREFQAIRVQSREEMEKALDQHQFDVVLSDHDMPGFSAFDALDVINNRDMDVPFIIVTGAIGGEEAAVELMRKGANDYVPKHKIERLPPAIRREIRDASIRQSKRNSDEALHRKNLELQSTIRSLTKAQDELVRTSRLKGLGEMAGSVMLEFNNTLAKSLAIIELLAGEKISGTQIYVEQLKASTLEAASIIKRLSYFHDVSPRKGSGDPVDINSVIRKSLELTQPRWDHRHFTQRPPIRVLTKLGNVPAVLGNGSEFVEALTNLIFNACDAMPEGGELKISTHRNTRAVVVEIQDTGVGMSEDVLEKCLEPFFTTRGRMSTGLGMSWVNALIQRFGGVMRVNSQLGIGTTVHLRFAISDLEPARNGGIGSGTQCTQHPLKIVLVEDERTTALCLANYLIDDEHEVAVFQGGFAALDHLRENYADVVILDRAMPEIGGDELALRIRALKGREKIVMATGFGDLMIASCETPEGVDMILPKPITRDALRRALNDVGAFLPA